MDFIYHATGDGRDICYNVAKVKILFSDGSSLPIIDTDQIDFQITNSYTSDKKIIGVNVNGDARRTKPFDGCHGDDEQINQNFYFPNMCQNYSISYQSEVNFNATTIFGNFTAKITPIHTFNSAIVYQDNFTTSRETFLPTEDKVTLSTTAGFDAYTYNYQYKFLTEPETAYRNISSSLFLLNKLNISAIDLFGINGWEAQIGKYINFRVVSCPEGSGFASKSNVVTLQVARSAPHIIGEIHTDVSCYKDSDDGSVTFTFDRELLTCTGCKQIPSPETLSYTLLDALTNTPIGVGSITIASNKTFTISNLKPRKYTIKLSGNYNGFITYASSVNHTRNFEIKKPLPLLFDATASKAYCAGGNDAQIIVDASGGAGEDATGFYEYSLNNGTTWTAFPVASKKRAIINAIPQGDYIVKVRDSRNCVARIPKIVNNVVVDLEAIEKTINLSTIQNKIPVNINYSFTKEPTYFGGSNGIIVASVTGGTPFKDASNKIYYQYEWKNASGTLLNPKTTTAIEGNVYKISLQDIPAGAYYLTIKDQNYSLTTQNTGCTDLANIEKILPQPAKLEIKFTIKQAISCHKDNAFGNETDANIDGVRDESQNGIIEATVTGGVPFATTANNGNPYQYQWKKLDNSNQWQPLGVNTFVASNLSDGQYALNVIDANGISVGSFANGAFTPQDQTIQLQQPQKFELSFTKQDVSCGSGSDGWATALPKGGVPPYQYSWSNSTSATSQNITSLTPGNYFVRVTDKNGCAVQGAINLPQPAGITITDSSKNPTCAQGNDGSINLQISGGKPNFKFKWNTGATTEDISNISAGNYAVTIIDGNGCNYFYSVLLTDPSPIVVNLGPDRTLCNDQSLDLDISIPDPSATYQWTSNNGFTAAQPKVNLKTAGQYHAQVVSGNGCIGEDDIIIKNSQLSINSEFFVTSQAYLDDEVVLVNTSDPFGEDTEWVIPTNVTIVRKEEKFIILKFNSLGTQTISLKQTQGDCYALYSKSIAVEEKTTIANAGITNTPFIKDFRVTPNPSNGEFNAIINLQENSPVKLRLYSYIGQTPIVQKSDSGQKNYVIDFKVNLPAGTYVLVLETSQQTLVRKIIIF